MTRAPGQARLPSPEGLAPSDEGSYARPVLGGAGSLTDQTLNGLVWQFAGAGVELAVRVTVMIVLARLLEPAEFGVASAATVVLSVAQIFAQLGVAQSIVQLRHLSADDVRSGFALSVASGVLAAVMIFLGAPAIAGVFRMPSLEPVIALLSFAFLMTGPAIVPAALLQRQRRYRLIAGVDASSFILGYAAVGIGMALLGFGLWSLIFAQLSQTAIRSITYIVMRPHEKSLIPVKGSLGRLLNSGAGYSLGQIGNFLALNGDNFAVGRWMGAASLGFYSRSYQFLSIPSTLFGSVVDKVLFPAMAHVQADPPRLSRAYRRSLAAIALITLPASAVMVVLAPELVNVVLGTKWSRMTLPFQILAATLMFRTSYKMSDSLARATGAVYRRAWRQWVYAVAVIVGAAVGTHWGLAGVSVGVGAAIVLNFVLMLQLATRVTSVSWAEVLNLHLRQALGAAPTALCVVLCTHLTRSMGLAPAGVLGAGVVAAGFALLFSILLARPMFGEDGRWILDFAESKLTSAIDRVGNRGARRPARTPAGTMPKQREP